MRLIWIVLCPIRKQRPIVMMEMPTVELLKFLKRDKIRERKKERKKERERERERDRERKRERERERTFCSRFNL